MNDWPFPILVCLVGVIASLAYWAAHDPTTIRMYAAWHLRRHQTLVAWAKAQDARKKVFDKAMAKYEKKPVATVTHTEIEQRA